MNLISNNPYRILGLPITASEREIAKQINDLATYAEMGKTRTFDTDFPYLPSINRTTNIIEVAKKQIEQNENKLLYSILWFWKSNIVDEFAFEFINQNNSSRAISTLEKSVFANKHKAYKQIVLIGDLVEQSNEWVKAEGDDHILKKSGGEYTVHRLKETSGSVPCVDVDFSYDDNWTIECETIWMEGVDNIGYGIIFGREKGNLFTFEIASNGYYSLGKYLDWNYSKLLPWKKCEIINKWSINELKIEKIDTKLNLYLNGIYVDSFPSEPFFGNKFGFVVDKNQKVVFKNFRFCKLIEDESYGEGINITSRNYSNLKNVGLLFLSLSSKEGVLDHNYLRNGLVLFNKFLSDANFFEYTKLIAGDKYANNTEKIYQFFIGNVIDSLKDYIEKPNGISIAQLIKLFSAFPSEGKNYISSRFVGKPIQSVDREIAKAQSTNINTPSDFTNAGKLLAKSTKNDITFLKSILGENDIQYQIIADKLSLAIGQCGINAYNLCKTGNGEIDYIKAIESEENYLQEYEYACSIAEAQRAKEKAEENLRTAKELIADKTERIKRQKTGDSFDYIERQLNSTVELLLKEDHGSKVLLETKAKDLIDNTKTTLNSIKTILGSTDKTYIKISSDIVSIVLACMVSYINTTSSITGVASSSIKVVDSLYYFDMDNETRTRYETNRNTLYGMRRRTTSTRNTSSGNCYIATMVYGSYEAPEVLILRKFRDEILAKYLLGRSFIQFYYKYSPHMVKRFRNNTAFKRLLKSILDNLIKILPK